MRVIDFHAHAFPDAVAEKAMPTLEKQGNVEAPLDGKVSSLLRSMDETGIDISVVASIATKPKQFEPILNWSKEIASDRLIPFPSVHPGDSDAVAHVRAVREAGFKGVKLHPYYQRFDLDEARVFPIYEALLDCGLILLCHTGFDKAFPRDRKADPVRIARVRDRFPDLLLVTSHVGAWQDWEEVRRCLLGKPVYMDLSYSLQFMGNGARDFLVEHPDDYLIFGTDSPWEHPRDTIRNIRSLKLGDEAEAKIFGGNAERLLGLPPSVS